MAFGYPVMLEVRGRLCVVVGGGEVGEAKVRGLLSAGAHVTVVDPAPGPAIEDLAELGAVTLVRRAYEPGDLRGAFVAVAATDDPDTNALIFREAEAERVLLNAVDDIQHCHFAVPSIIRRGDLLLTLSTGGKAPALSKRMRKHLSAEFGEEYATLVDLLGEVREEAVSLRRQVPFAEWAARWEEALEADLISLVRDGRYQEVKDHVRLHLEGRPEERPGHVWIVGAGPGAPGLITVDGRRALDRADVVVYDRLVDPSLVEGKQAVYAGKVPGDHGASQEEINQTLIRLAAEGKRVVRLKGGDPFVFGRGAEEAEALAGAGIGFTVIPGPTSAIAAAAAAGIPVTDRRFSSSVAIVTGHSGQSRVDWRTLAQAVETIVVLMGLANAPFIAGELMAGGLDGETPVAVVENGTRPGQRVVVTKLANLGEASKDAGFGSPSLLVIGRVVTLRETLSSTSGVKA